MDNLNKQIWILKDKEEAIKERKPFLGIFIFVLLACAFSVNAVLSDLTINLSAYYTFDGATSNYISNISTLNNATVVGAGGVSVAGKIGKSINCSDQTAYVTLNDTGDVFDFGNNSFTINYWEIRNTNNNARATYSRDNTGYPPLMLGFAGFNPIQDFSSSDGATWNVLNGVSVGNTALYVWQMYSAVRDGSRFLTYRNATLISNVSMTTPLPDKSVNAQICRWNSNAERLTEDEWGFWKNRALSTAELVQLYNSGTGCQYNDTSCFGNVPAVIGNLTFNSQTPNNNTQFNYTNISYTVNFTNQQINETNIFVQCSLTVNSVVADSPYGAINGTGTLTTSYVSPTGTINYNWTCINQDIPSKNFTSPTYIIYSDIVFPTITTNLTNKSIFISNVTANFTFLDDQAVFDYNVSLNGVQKYFGLINGTTNNVSINYNSDMPIGTNLITARVADGHTAKELKDSYSISTGIFGDVLQFSTPKNTVKIQEKNKNINDRWEATKQLDRYSFKYTPTEKPKDSYTFVVDCSQDISVINRPDLEYKAWLVCGNKWIDFKVKNNPGFSVSIKSNTKKQAEVTVGNLLNSNYIEFESIGELNIYEANYTVYRVNASAQFVNNETETHTQSNYLYLNKTSNENTTAEFHFNVTNITSIIKTSTEFLDVYNATFVTPLLPTSVVPINWNFTFYGDINNITDGISATQSVTNLIISNCSLPTEANYTSRTYFIYGADGITKLKSNITGVFQIWHGDRILTQHMFSLSWYNQDNATICIRSDNNEGISYDLSMIVASSGYATSTVVEFNGTLNLTPTTQNIFLITATTNFILKLINQISDALPGYAIAQNEYDVTTDTQHFVSSLTTDINGQVLFYYNPTKQYNFTITDSVGNIVLVTNLMYIVQNPTTIKLDVSGVDILGPTLGAWDLRTILYNASNIIYLNWTTLSGTSGTICLNVTHINATSSDFLFGSCSSAPFGSLTYTFSATEGTINAVAFIKGSTYVTNILNILLNGVLKIWNYMGTSAMLLYIIFIIIAVGISVTRVTAMPFALIAAHLVSWWMGLIPGTWGFTVVVLCALAAVAIRVRD